jgi:hypothetical protein
MGGSSSKTSTDIYTQQIVEAFSKTLQNCEGNTIINQQVTIRGNYNVVKKVRLVQGMKLSTSCAMNEQNVAATQQSVESAIKQQAEAQSIALIGALGNADSTNETTIRNEVRTAITRESIQNIVNNFNAAQEFLLDGNNNIVEDVTMEQSMEILHENIMGVLSQMSSVQDIKNKAEQVATSKQTNPVSEIIDSVGSIVENIGMMWMIVIVVAIAVGGYVLVNGGLGAIFADSDPGYMQQNPNQPYQPYTNPNLGQMPPGPYTMTTY